MTGRVLHMGCWLLGAVALATGCGGNETPVSITESRPADAPPVIPEGVTQAQRFDLNRLPPDHPPVSTAHATDKGSGMSPEATAGAPGDVLHWNVPDGWTVGAARPMRVVTLRAGAVECYVAELSGSAGGALANFNRWAGQMGQPPLSAEAFAALPTLTVLGATAPLLDITGTYVGMGETSQPDNRMLGTLAPVGPRTFFIKLVGPAAEVASQRDAFVAFCASLHLPAP